MCCVCAVHVQVNQKYFISLAHPPDRCDGLPSFSCKKLPVWKTAPHHIWFLIIMLNRFSNVACVVYVCVYRTHILHIFSLLLCFVCIIIHTIYIQIHISLIWISFEMTIAHLHKSYISLVFILIVYVCVCVYVYMSYVCCIFLCKKKLFRIHSLHVKHGIFKNSIKFSWIFAAFIYCLLWDIQSQSWRRFISRIHNVVLYRKKWVGTILLVHCSIRGIARRSKF